MKSVTNFCIFFILFLAIQFQTSSCKKSIDNLPSDITELSGSSSNSEISLTWVDPLDKEFVKVLISYDDTSFEVVKGIQKSLITNLTRSKEYNFLIRTSDSRGQKSSGKKITITAIDDTGPSNVSDLKIINGLYEVTLTWKDPIDKDFTEVRISNGDSSFLVSKGVQTINIRYLTSGTEYAIRISTLDKYGNLSEEMLITGNPDFRNKYTGDYEFSEWFETSYVIYWVHPIRDTTFSGIRNSNGRIEKYQANQLKIVFRNPCTEPDLGIGTNIVYFPMMVDGLLYPTISETGLLSYYGANMSYSLWGSFTGSDSMEFHYGILAQMWSDHHVLRGKKLKQF
jgi:hypothetical protein